MLRNLKKKFYSSKTVVRQFGKYSGCNKKTFSLMSERFKLLAEENLFPGIRESLDTSNVDIDKFRGKRVVHVSTWNTTCGIAAYCKSIKEGLDELNILAKNDVIPIDPNFVHHATYLENKMFYSDVAEQCCDYDIIIVQYEFGFFASDKYIFPKDIELFSLFINNLRSKNPKAKILIYIHTSLMVLGFESIMEFFELSETFVKISKLDNIYFMANTIDLISDWYSSGVKACLGIDPVKKFYKNSLFVKDDLRKQIEKHLNLQENDVVLMMLGFINPMKRYDEMAEILALLPSNYKLLAAGGIFPDSPRKYLRIFKDKIKKLKLENRVYITGLFNDDDLGTYFDIADIMCAPYGKVRSGSGSIPMLLLPEKPIVAYSTEMIGIINSQCNYSPIIEVPFDDRSAFKKELLTLVSDKSYYAKWQECIKNYSNTVNDNKLALLVLKTLEDKCLKD